MRIALCQTDRPPETRAGIADCLETAVGSAATGGAGLVILPELALAGYGDSARNRSLAMTRGELVGLAGQVARHHEVSILMGYCERDARGHLFNSAMLISSNGRELTNYRKMHLWGEYERETFQPGEMGEVVEIAPGLRCGILICFDLDHPFTAQDLAARGADIILVLSATSWPYEIVPNAQVPVRAYENSTFLAFCNLAGTQSGLSFVGRSAVAAPDGSILVRARPDVGDTVFAEVEPERFARYRRGHRYRDALRKDLFLR